MEIPAYVKQHPVQVAGIAVVAVLAIYLLTSSGGSSGSGVQSSGPTDAQLQAGLQQSQIDAASQANIAQVQGAIALAATKSASDFAIAQLSAQTTTAQQVNQLSYMDTHDQLAYNLGVVTATDTTSVQNNTINTQGAINLAGINANVDTTALIQNAAVTENQQNNATQSFIAQTVAQLQAIISGNNSNVAITQSNNNVAIAKVIADAQTTKGWQGILGHAISPFQS